VRRIRKKVQQIICRRHAQDINQALPRLAQGQDVVPGIKIRHRILSGSAGKRHKNRPELPVKFLTKPGLALRPPGQLQSEPSRKRPSAFYAFHGGPQDKFPEFFRIGFVHKITFCREWQMHQIFYRTDGSGGDVMFVKKLFVKRAERIYINVDKLMQLLILISPDRPGGRPLQASPIFHFISAMTSFFLKWPFSPRRRYRHLSIRIS